MAFLDIAIVTFIVLFIVFLVWSRVMNQSMLDTLTEIKDILSELKGG
jgi:hypothetical protein